MNVNDLFNAIGNIDESLLSMALDQDSLAADRAAKRKIFIRRLSGAVAAAVVITLFLTLGLPRLFPVSTPKPVTEQEKVMIYMKINPYVCINATADGDILSIEALNGAGQQLLDEYDFEDDDPSEIASGLISCASDMGYLKEDGEIIFSVVSEDKTLAEKCINDFESFADEISSSYEVKVREIISEKKAEASCIDYLKLERGEILNLTTECHADESRASYKFFFETDICIIECDVDATDGSVFATKHKHKEPSTEYPTEVITATPEPTDVPTEAPTEIPETEVPVTATPAPTKAPVTQAPTKEPVSETEKPKATTDPAEPEKPSHKPKPPVHKPGKKEA